MILRDNKEKDFTILEVALPIPLDSTFSYFLDGDSFFLPPLFSRAKVEFNHRIMTGFIVGVDKTDSLPDGIKPVLKVLDNAPLLRGKMPDLASWISDYYLVPLGVVLSLVSPFDAQSGFDIGEIQRGDFPPGIMSVKIRDEKALQKVKGKKQRIFIENLLKKPGATSVNELPGLSSESLQSLIKQGYVSAEKNPLTPEAFVQGLNPVFKKTELTDEQSAIYNEVSEYVISEKHATFLLHGLTGSGKTEIYLKLAQLAVSLGKKVLILVPEISLTPQIAGRFCAHFPGRVAVWHSNLTRQQRRILWKFIYYDLVDIVIGARSSLFTPMDNLGLIIVDEEHEHTYKQEEPDPRYHARDVAVMRGNLENCPVLLGSATPSLESYYNQSIGKYRYLSLSERYGESIPPEITVVDMSTERLEVDNPETILSRMMCDRIQEILAKDEQAILLQNRRGFSPIIFCAECGYTVKCKNCNITMTFHKTTNSLKCHYCGYHRAAPYQCPSCRGSHIIFYGWGTQHVEEILQDKFPGARILRMDMDSTRKSGAHGVLLQKFALHEYDILLGTQMIAKGLDFPDVTLVGIIDADVGLNLPDFRSRERTFQLIYQVSGRSGRGKKRGCVVLQTTNPDDPALRLAIQHNIKGFYNREMADRSQLNYPPFSRMINIKFSGKDRNQVNMTAKKVFNFLVREKGRIRLIGPSPAPLDFLRGQYRYQLIAKSGKKSDPGGNKLRQMIRSLRQSDYFRKLPGSVTIKFDVDPVSLM